MKTNNTMPPQDEREFICRVRYALDEQITHLPHVVINRLSKARKIALTHQKSKPTPFFTTICSTGIHKLDYSCNGALNWLWRVGIIVPILVLILGSIGIYYREQERRVNELAELDAAVLTDDLPINAYLDHRFDAYLNESGE